MTRNSESRVLDAIDELVDEQLRQESSGYDHNINQDRCAHCGEGWHGLAVKERMREIRDMPIGCGCDGCRRGQDRALAKYDYAADNSPVICPGSAFIGPWITPSQLRLYRAGITGIDFYIAELSDIVQTLVYSSPPQSVEEYEVSGDGYTRGPAVDERAPWLQFEVSTPVRTRSYSWGVRTTTPNPYSPTTDQRELDEPAPVVRNRFALPRPSTEPPMWADQPERSRRRDRNSRLGVGDWRRNG